MPTGLEVHSILNDLKGLDRLTSLAFPRDSHWGHLTNLSRAVWPPNLRQITLSGQFLLAKRDFSWERFAHHWPPSIQHIIVHDCKHGWYPDGHPGRHLHDDWARVLYTPHKLESLRVTGRNSHLYPEFMLTCCLGARVVSVPANIAGTIDIILGEHHIPRLEELEIRYPKGNKPHKFSPLDLVDYAQYIQTLLKIRVYKTLVKDGHEKFVARADQILRDRAARKNREAGATVVKPKDCGVVLLDSRGVALPNSLDSAVQDLSNIPEIFPIRG
jgi:hypothetical protein